MTDSIDHRSLLREIRVTYPVDHQRPSWVGLFHCFSVLDDMPVAMIEDRFGKFEAVPFMHVEFTDRDEEEV